MAARNRELSEQRLLHGTVRELEEAFIKETSALRAEDPLTPMVVLVPNHLLCSHLPRRLAAAGCAHANVMFYTLNGLARRLAADALALEGKAPLPEFCAELALARAIKQAGELEYFAPVAAKRGFQAAMLATCRDLKNARLTPDGLDRVVRGIAPRDLLRRKLNDVSRLWRSLESAKLERGFYDEADLFERAAREAAGGWMSRLTRLTVYGLYDFNPAQKHLLAACCEQSPATVYLPWNKERAFHYAQPAYDWFAERGFVPQRAPEATCEVPDKPSHGVTPEILLISAPARTQETEEIVREIVHSERDDDAATFGVLLRAQEPYRSLLKELFDAIGLKGYFHGGLPFHMRPAGHAMGLLAGLLNGRLRRGEVMEFFAAAPLRPVADGIPAPPVEQWNHFSRRAGIVEGAEEWQRNLKRLADDLAQSKPRDEDETPRAAEPAEQASLAAFRQSAQLLSDGLRKTAQARSWERMAGAFGELFLALADAGEDRAKAESILESIAELDVMGTPPNPELFQEMLLGALERPVRGETRYGAAEPTIAALMDARGATFDVVLLPGMVEGVFPAPARQDPILLDAERARLSAALREGGLPAELPLKGRRREEEEMLFALAAQSARRRLIISFPRLDASDGRARIPSPFLLDVVRSLTGKPADYRALEEFVRGDAHGRCVGVGPEAVPRSRALRAVEYDLAALHEAARAQQPDALLYLSRISPFFAQALEGEIARWGRGEFSEYDGIIRNPALLASRPIRRHEEEVASPTRLESYARCPFEFFMRHALGLEPMEEPERVARLSPMNRGSLMHGILYEFMTEAVKRGEALPEYSRTALGKAAQQRFERFERNGLTGFPMMWRIEQARMLRELRLALARQLEDAEGFQPALFEVRFGLPPGETEESESSTTEPARLEIAPGRTARFGGRIDRIDRNVARRESRVIDYKTGRAPERKDNAFAGGQALQLPAYLLAAAMVMPDAPPALAEYLYLDERSEKRSLRFDRQDWPEKLRTFRSIVKTILDGIAEGRFFPSPEEFRCRNCDYRAACGHGFMLEHKWKADVAATRDYVKMNGIE